MEYYTVYPASSKYHPSSGLTYAAKEVLQPGNIVSIPLKDELVLGFIHKKVAKPRFATKQIATLPHTYTLPLAARKLHEWLLDYYPAPGGSTTQLFLPSVLAQKSRIPYDPPTPLADSFMLPELTKAQADACAQILSSQGPFLLHGDTGTGKTRVYTEIAAKTLDSGKNCIILTPEIGLTPQLEATISERFPGKVITIHSRMSAAQRRNIWQYIVTSTTPCVVLGPRSALFSPLSNVGLIVVDEMHDQAYKQEQAPHYQTTRVAAKLATLHGATLIMGSATPPVDDYFAFQRKKLPILRIQQPAISHTYTTRTTVVSLRDAGQFSKSKWLSTSLIDAITGAMRSHKQSLVFLNRRGTARLILCQNCDWRALCPRCDVPLTYHGDTHTARCHTCGHQTTAPSSCPVCASADIVFRSIGTKSIVHELERLLPHAKIERFDGDNNISDNLSARYNAVASGDVDIIVGTQMLTKGLDLPHLAVVGIVIADTSLYFPDYTAEERTYQQLTQVMGRVGRGHTDGTVIIQTYNPDSSAIKAVVDGDYASFYQRELTERKAFHFPPYVYVLKCSVSRASAQAAQKAALNAVNILAAQHIKADIIGPSPAFNERVHGTYQWQIVLKAHNRSELLRAIEALPSGWSYDIDPSNLL